MHQDTREHWPIIGETAARIVETLFRSRNHIWENDHRIVDEFGLTWAQFMTLVALRKAPPPHRLSPTELYSAVQVTSGGLTKVLDGLEADGYVRRLANPSDGRSRFAQLTPKGSRLVETIITELVKVNGDIFSEAMTEAECSELARLLQKLSVVLDGRTRP